MTDELTPGQRRFAGDICMMLPDIVRQMFVAADVDGPPGPIMREVYAAMVAAHCQARAVHQGVDQDAELQALMARATEMLREIGGEVGHA